MEEEHLLIYLNILQIWTNFQKLLLLVNNRRKVRRRWWVKPHLFSEIRNNVGAHAKLFTYFRTSDHDEFFEMTRMSVHQFDHLHELLKPKLLKRSRREPLPTELRVAVTLRLVIARTVDITCIVKQQNGKHHIFILIPVISHMETV